ncbi:capsule biosynthesis protein [Aquicoccus sp. SCR17]|nr:capsule biosynthesis protein [Carideicomes alvinocaridis]
MTTKPKARKFRIRHGVGAGSAGGTGSAAGSAARAVTTPEAEEADVEARTEPATRPEPPQGGLSGDMASARQVNAETEIDAIRREGLTGRQLRMARRVAQKHGLPATSDFDAIRLLRAKGIDPFQRTNMLELVINDNEEPPREPGRELQLAGERMPQRTDQKLPQTVPAGQPPAEPQPRQNPAERRAAEIMQIQRDISRRRRKKLILLLTRLSFFVLLPTALVGWYFYVMATPMYATDTEFLILKNEQAGSAVSGLFSGTQFATNQDAIAVQSYLESKDAMQRLDRDEGFMAHFQQDWIDPIQRLSEDATTEAAYSLYQDNVTIGYDPTEGVIRMEVSAADPQVSARFSLALLDYAEERVDELTREMRTNSVSDAERQLEAAQQERREAQERLVTLQQEGAILDPEGRIAALRSQINNVELQIQEKQLQLQALLDNARPNQAKVDGARGDVERLQAMRAQINNEMTSATQGENSLAELAARIQLAQSDLANTDLLLQSALDQLQSARREANSQARYLTTSVKPVPPDEASYPRKFENTILAFLIFSGVYLMISLTASILREQVTS